MESTLRIIEAIGKQWPFLIVLFSIIVIVLKWKTIGKFLNNISDVSFKRGSNEVSIKQNRNPEIKETVSLESEKWTQSLIDKTEFSEILLAKLKDSNTYKIDIITYTNEVETGQINHYKVSGNKKIRIFKRSYISDRYEQQLTNINRFKNFKDFRRWSKDQIILNTSESIEQEFLNNENIEIQQFFYDHFPRLRAYIFDDEEAVFSFYELSEDSNGSMYKGMNKGLAMKVDKNSGPGTFLLNLLKSEVKFLERHSRNFAYESYLIENGHNNVFSSLETPVYRIKAVFFDMDGVLYDSLWQYQISWSNGFKEFGIDLGEKDVYYHEGRSGTETVKFIFNQYLNRQPTSEEITRIKEIRDESLLKCGKPKVQEGILEILKQIISNNITPFIVTGSSRKSTITHIGEDFGEYISEKDIISGLDSQIGKPNPEPYLIALHRAGLKPTEVVVIENAPLGISSSKSAGLFTIAVNTGPLTNEELKNAGADVVFKSCFELSNHWNQIQKELE